MYKLYFNKREKRIEISPVKNTELMALKVSNEVTMYNDCYFICNDRKQLKEKANEIRNEWIIGLEEELEKVNNMKIKNKY